MCSDDVCLRFICSAFLMTMLMADVLLAANPKRGLGANEDIKITVCEQSSLHSLIPCSPSFPSPLSKQVFLLLWMRLLPVEHSLLRVIIFRLLLIDHLTLGYPLLPSPSFLPGDLYSFSLTAHTRTLIQETPLFPFTYTNSANIPLLPNRILAATIPRLSGSTTGTPTPPTSSHSASTCQCSGRSQESLMSGAITPTPGSPPVLHTSWPSMSLRTRANPTSTPLQLPMPTSSTCSHLLERPSLAPPRSLTMATPG